MFTNINTHDYLHIYNYDAQDICVDAEFEKLHKDIEQSRTLKIHHGGVLGSFGQKPKKKKKRMLITHSTHCII